jgi:murein DD-endopeptidase / murein LD-carboxypeptidase
MKRTFYEILFVSMSLMIFSVACRTTKNIKTPLRVNEDTTGFYNDYSKILGANLTGSENKYFIKEISGWLGTPYLMGGTTKEGVDCSGFVQLVYKTVYNISIYRTAADLVKNCDMIDKKDLKTGDLIFFKINSSKISHVGIYIDDGKFIHASSAKGVIVSNFSDAYYTKYFYSCGRIKNLK